MTLYTSDSFKQGSNLYLLITIVCQVFSMIYESFSHHVYSPYMVFAPVIPMIGGVLMAELMNLLPKEMQPGQVSVNLYNASIGTWIVGSLVQGALEIYGTEHPHAVWYRNAGSILFGVAAAVWLVKITACKSKYRRKK